MKLGVARVVLAIERGHMPRRAALIAVGWFAAAAAAVAAPPPQSVVEAILAREAIQRDLPMPSDAPRPFKLDPELVRWLLRAGVIVGIVVIVFSLRDSLPAWDRSRRLATSDDGARRNSGETLAAAGLEADDLAGAGLYGEAMHMLLLRAVGELRDRLRVAFADSLTSREIARRAPLDERGRAAFAGIVGEVEAVVFGEFGADAAAYRACRDKFETLRDSLAAASGR
jgi:hypothetical protein